MSKDIIFEELGKKEKILLLRAFDYDVDNKGFIRSPTGVKIQSKETPGKYIKINDSALIPGSLDIIEGTPSSLSKFIRDRVEK
ncbi:MAG: hypothetical protein ACTSUV_01600 [Candidatus Ranarchaeia archaeon]